MRPPPPPPTPSLKGRGLKPPPLEGGGWGRGQRDEGCPSSLSTHQFSTHQESGSVEAEIIRIGSDGDGIAELPDGTRCYLPETLPGERVRARLQDRRGDGWSGQADILSPSADRALPSCPHFGAQGDDCGGCALQHWRDDAYATWKSGQVEHALLRAGAADVTMRPLARTAPAARRRMDLAARRNGTALHIGLHARRSRDVVDMHACPVLHPTLFGLISPMRTLLSGVNALRREGSVIVNLLDSGADILLRTDAELTPARPQPSRGVRPGARRAPHLLGTRRRFA